MMEEYFVNQTQGVVYLSHAYLKLAMNRTIMFSLMVSFALVFAYGTAAYVYAQSPSGGEPILGGNKGNGSSTYNQTFGTDAGSAGSAGGAGQQQQGSGGGSAGAGGAGQQQQGSGGGSAGAGAGGAGQQPLRAPDASSNMTIVAGQEKQQNLSQSGGPLGQLSDALRNLTGGNK
jgi:hypothetical protein